MIARIRITGIRPGTLDQFKEVARDWQDLLERHGLGVSYNSKFSIEEARGNFTQPDLIHFLGQGFLWPSTWPALATFIGLERIDPPAETSHLINSLFALLA